MHCPDSNPELLQLDPIVYGGPLSMAKMFGRGSLYLTKLRRQTMWGRNFFCQSPAIEMEWFIRGGRHRSAEWAVRQKFGRKMIWPWKKEGGDRRRRRLADFDAFKGKYFEKWRHVVSLTWSVYENRRKLVGGSARPDVGIKVAKFRSKSCPKSVYFFQKLPKISLFFQKLPKVVFSFQKIPKNYA